MMFAFETLATTPPEAQQVASAFYRCLERLGAGSDGEAYMRKEQLLNGERITIRLWSAEALAALRAELSLRGPAPQLR